MTNYKIACRAFIFCMGENFCLKKAVPNNFCKGVKWSPDGSCFMAVSEDTVCGMYAVPPQTLDACRTIGGISTDEAEKMQSGLAAWSECEEGETIFDFCWNPVMNWADKNSTNFILVSRGHPIHLRDCHDCRILATYRPMNFAEEVTHGHSLVYTPDGTGILCGQNNIVWEFDIEKPGVQLYRHILATRRGTHLPLVLMENGVVYLIIEM
eukprot:GHVL01028480.1.p1 GENE.GHVL01028480.1~~GHVL01028480.1.p1  ORF type:complete len:210 (+),score=25.83 GHVL01028480.1:2547-3176(+)